MIYKRLAFVVGCLLLLFLSGCGSNETDLLPATPSGLSATPGDGEVTLSWTANGESDLKGYNIYQREAADGLSVVEFIEAGTETFTVTGLTNAQEYFFAIEAVDEANQPSGLSTVASATPTASDDGGGDTDTLPATPTGLTVTAGDGQVTLTWNANSESDLRGYNVYQGEALGSLSAIEFVEASTETFIATGLTNGQDYLFAIDAEDTAGQLSEKSPVIPVTPTSGGDGGNGGNGGGGGEPVMIHEDARVLGEEGRNNLTSFDLDVASGQGELRFKVGDPAVAALEPGLILVSQPVPGVVPYGFLQRIESKRQEGNVIIFETTQANLLEVLGQAEIRLNEELQPVDVVNATAFYDGITLSYAPEGIAPQGDISYNFNIDFNKVLIDQDGNESTTNDQLRIDGAFNFDATASAGIDICFCGEVDWAPDWAPQLEKMYGKVRLEESVDVSLTGELALSFNKSIPVASFNFGTFTVFAGPVPVVFVVDMVITVGANGQIEAHLEASAVQSSVVQVGIEYTHDHGWRDLNEFDFSFDFPTPEITAAASARAFLRPQLNVQIYGLAGPYLYAEAFVEADAELFRDPFWRFTAGIDFGIGFLIELPVVGRIAEYETELVGFEETLAESSNQAPSLTVLSGPADGERLLTASKVYFGIKAQDREQQEVPVVLTNANGQELSATQVKNDDTASLSTPCLEPGSYTFNVTATDNEGQTDRETRSVVVENVKPEVTLRKDLLDNDPNPLEPLIAPGLYFPATATVVDTTCADPDNAADPALIKWFVDGQAVGSGDELFYRLDDSYNPNDTFKLEARYDDGADVGEASVVVTVEKIPDGYVPQPTAVIKEPKDGDFFPFFVDIELKGYAYNPSEGELTGATYLWEVKVDSQVFQEVATGKTAILKPYEELRAPNDCSFNSCSDDYTLRLTVTDSEGIAVSTTIVITLGLSG